MLLLRFGAASFFKQYFCEICLDMRLLIPFYNQLTIHLPDSTLRTFSSWPHLVDFTPLLGQLCGGFPRRGTPYDVWPLWFLLSWKRHNLAFRTPHQIKILYGWASSSVRSVGRHRQI